MPTLDLITAAEAAKTKKTETATALVTAQQDDDHAGLDVTSTTKALHDDLATNGPFAKVDVGPPVVVTLYASVDPADYSATPVRTS